jgi:hypothetical protein
MKTIPDLTPLQRAILLSIKPDPKPGMYRNYSDLFRSFAGLLVLAACLLGAWWVLGEKQIIDSAGIEEYRRWLDGK